MTNSPPARPVRFNKNKNIPLRTLIIISIFGVFALILIGRLFFLQVVAYDKYRTNVLNNVEQQYSVAAARGIIYDRNGIPIAANMTTWRIFLDPANIQAYEKSLDGKKLADGKGAVELIAHTLSSYLASYGSTYADVSERALKANRRDETVAKNVVKDDADKVREFIDEYHFERMIYLQETSTRYYPNGTLAAQVIGYMGTDSGLFGLELKYNSQLTGTPGMYITAKNARSQDMGSKYDVYVAPVDGLSAITTIDVNLQLILENQLKIAYEVENPRNRVTGIVMDVNTGGILAMATYPTFDLNDPFTLDTASATKLAIEAAKITYPKNSDEYKNAYQKLYMNYVYAMWSNKAVSELYEPGSTFKIVTAAAALDEGVVTMKTMFSCGGVYNVAGANIHCHKTSGHGTHTFEDMLQLSCNPTLMQVGQRLGASAFYKYFTAFGFAGKTGIDLPGESLGLYHSLKQLGPVELATSSFGQTFKTTPIQELTAIATVANGGYLITPHVVSKMVDSKGNVVLDFEVDKTKNRQVVSTATCKLIAETLEKGVSADPNAEVHGATGAYVPGYKVAAKTGTSEKRDKLSEKVYVGSCVAFAPADNPQVAVLILNDEPTKNYYGAATAAPYVQGFLEQALPAMGFVAEYTEKELAARMATVGNYVGQSLDRARQMVANNKLQCTVIGTGSKVVAQLPASGEVMKKEGKVILYMGGDGGLPEDNKVSVPNVSNGRTLGAAKQALLNAGFNVKISGSDIDSLIVDSQSIAAASSVPKGTLIILYPRDKSSDEYWN